MGQDDDADCVEHVWHLGELVLHRGNMHRVKTCSRCPATAYDDQAAERADRPPLL